MTTTTTDELTARYWKLARKSHAQGVTANEAAELRKLSRALGFKAYA